MKHLIGRLSSFLALLLFFATGLMFLSQAALAPTAEINILGASTTEQSELANLVTYELDASGQEKVRAASYLVEDYPAGQVVMGKQMDNSLPIASLTKLMTVWTVLEHATLDETFTVPALSNAQVSPSLGLKAGDEVKVGDLVQAVLIGSANDAALVLGNYVGAKTELPFGELMNQEAVELGLANSRFNNPMGFDSVVNYSSARDLAKLVHELDKKNVFAESGKSGGYEFISETGISYSVSATNKLVAQYPDLTAVKTGYTNLALGAMINFLQKGDQRWLIIVIGSPDREADTLELRKQLLAR